ncbi:M56 family metallopeptidase [Winogradskyella psychrotolerans]|uniref:M56 family metallopeptidase n=1 Tax=Winogradskyella psychrotolerans TaxID=1344585 RepID=UPI001C075ECB|nr:M56 family metallopeptidase [Winogradskyella psychrotolerans]MBU2921999.1 M56 family metallopeptidase [Winogradskyella psychrotolerans]
MEIFVLKFSACLLVFWLVYVLILEQQNMHHFKRFYLLGTVALALIIPTLTVTEYIAPVISNLETAPLFIPIEPSFVEMPIEDRSFFNLETTLWFIYGIGVLLFSIRFVINIVKMQQRISSNENIVKRSFVYVLLKEHLIPHSFFKYIFYNKNRYESHNIPKEVMLHEETHARQLHSLDIIILELLQIAFWFHPLIYILKHHVKLNHEFLADQAVLKHGSDAKTYQNILLQFSSNTQNHHLSSAINYSSIKKRFTVMKTQTSKTRIWLSTLFVLPIIAILFYSFAEKEYVEKETTDIADAIKEELKEVDVYKHQYVGDNIVEIYLEKFNQYEILRNDKPHYIHKSESEKNQMEDLFSDLGGIYFRMSKENKAKVKRPISPIKPYVQITLKDKTYYKKYKELTAEEKATLPPPPPPAKNSQSYISIQEKPIMVILINREGDLLINDEQESISDIESKLKTLSKSFDKSRAVYIKYDGTENSYKIIKDVKSLIKKYNFKMIQADASQIAPPPPPPAPATQQTSKGGPNIRDTERTYNPSFLEYIIEMEQEGASFYLDDEKISAKEAKSIATNHQDKRTEMTTQKDSNGNYIVKLSSAENKKIYARSIELKILNNDSYLIDGIKATKRTFVDVFNQLHQDITPEIRNNMMNIHVKSTKEISNKETWFIYNSLQDYGFYRIVTPNQEINRAKGNTPFAIESHFSDQQTPSAKQIAEYNAWAKKINTAVAKAKANPNKNTYPIVRQKDVDKHKRIYNSMTTEQKKIAEPFPQSPPPPPPPTIKTGKVSDSQIEAYNNWVKSLKDPNGNHLMVKKEHYEYFTGIYNLMTEEQQKKSEGLPPPPAPPVPSTKQKQTYKFKTESGEIIEVVEDPQPQKQESILPIVNGEIIKTGKIALTRNEIKDIILSTKNGKVTEFKFKIPGKPTQYIKSDMLDIDAIKNLENAKKDDLLALFALKDGSNSKIAPMVITVTD